MYRVIQLIKFVPNRNSWININGKKIKNIIFVFTNEMTINRNTKGIDTGDGRRYKRMYRSDAQGRNYPVSHRYYMGYRV